MKIIIVGGGKVGYYLLKTLYGKKHKISIIERDPVKCARIAEEMGNVNVINGDGTEVKDLREAGAEDADVIAAVTGKDEVNLISCQIAKKNFNIPKTIARVNNPKNEVVLKSLGVDNVVCSTAFIANVIEQEVVLGAIRSLLTFYHGDLNILEIKVPHNSPSNGKRIMDIKLPRDSIIITVIKADKPIVPRGDTQIDEDDLVIIMSRKDKIDEIKAILVGTGDENEAKN
ncbi:potassium channel family protein [Athalassotoga saccharophila]|uniref:potassium channel family protein n=1 Tax=Athalassotoga saccharophila TaxID=1441386 RepID=UPI00137B7B31|nr:NAD-binding protein [Athalassotoga saccharophila]BBJ27818.1 trk system potassium uptake protein TrkA [Athalassotoga saccharophila]